MLLLGGTQEARELADRLADLPVATSLAGRHAGSAPAGRAGGFGGADGLRAWVAAHGVRLVVDATHPFAARISAHAAAAGVPLLRLQRPGWAEQPGDRWQRVPDLPAAARALAGRRALVTTGRQGAAHFAGTGCVLRCVEPPDPVPAGVEVLLDRGPYALDGELALLRGFEVLVTKDSGGTATRAKLDAARALGLPVVVVDRPVLPPAASVAGVDAAERWVRARLGESGP